MRHGSSGPMNQAVNSWTREYLHSEPSCWRGVPRYTAAELYVHETGAQQNRQLRLQLFQFGLDGGLVAVQACLNHSTYQRRAPTRLPAPSRRTMIRGLSHEKTKN